MKVLVVGGYGTFGGRLVDLLLDEGRLTIWVAGRNLKAAEKFCAGRSGGARLIPIELDRSDCGAVLRNIKPDLLVDASGPFQAYGDDPYSVVRECLAAGVNYIDLADGADFVAGISALDEQAKKAGCFALAGMSSFPVLTAAVVRKLSGGLSRVDEIAGGIAPSPFAGVGLNVIRAIASYSGKTVKVLRNGEWCDGTGFFDSKRLIVNVPGEIPLRPIRFALTDVPDLKVLSWDWPEVKSVWMGAGPTPQVLHRLLWLAAGLVKFRILPSLVPLAPVMNWVVNTVRWGEHRGGMIVEVTGQSTAGKVKRSWHLLAEGDGGPLIPSMAAEAVIRNCLAGKFPVRGARSGHRDLELEDYAPLLARHGIKTGLREERELSRQSPIYERILGEAYFRLARPLQEFHSRTSAFSMKGKADVVRGGSLASKLVARLIGFPVPGQNVDVEVTIDIDGQVETWTRKFERRVFQSRQKLGRGRYDGLIVESFGPIGFGIAVTENDGRLGLALRGWDILGLPMPRWAMPDGQAFEHGADGRFNFEVEIKLPVVGLIVGYKGWLKPVT